MTLICLISGQLAPNLLSVMQIGPETVVLVHTEDTKQQARHFGTMIRERYGVEKTVAKEVRPFHPLEIRKAAEEIAKEVENSSIVLNYTGGTKPMAVQFVSVFEPAGANLLYADTQQEKFWLAKNGNVSEIPFNFHFGLHTFFDLKEVNVQSQADNRVLDQMQGMTSFLFKEKVKGRRSSLSTLFDGAVDTRVNRKSLSGWNPHLQTSELQVETESAQKMWVSWMQESFPQKRKTFWLDYFSGGWFEQWCYSVLKKSGLFDDVRCNIKINPGNRVQPDYLKNEIDVAGISNAIPLFLECKSGRVDQKSITNLKAMRDFYGPTYSQGVLVSLWPVRSDVLKEKIADYGLGLAEGPKNLKEKLLYIGEQIIVRV